MGACSLPTLDEVWGGWRVATTEAAQAMRNGGRANGGGGPRGRREAMGLGEAGGGGRYGA